LSQRPPRFEGGTIYKAFLSALIYIKADNPDMFHFGGSSHCLIFRPSVKLEFDLHGQTPSLDSGNLKVMIVPLPPWRVATTAFSGLTAKWMPSASNYFILTR